jgi:hypothetical protein
MNNIISNANIRIAQISALLFLYKKANPNNKNITITNRINTNNLNPFELLFDCSIPITVSVKR